ncbi:MAG: tetratricopeptide repeat protein [Gammaproteobacteria bacterium]|nr:tetratricopeptide repeat protein [Gammaproteobacteria bacterium]
MDILGHLPVVGVRTGICQRAAGGYPPFGERIAKSPFVELYVLDELKQLRTDMAAQKHEMIQQIFDRELNSIDLGVEYATDTISYFFYLIAGASSILVLVGWSSIRDIKERVHSNADQQVAGLIGTYEDRLRNIEIRLSQKTELYEENRAEIALTQELHSLWLRAGQDTGPHNKIATYDQILKLQPEDTEALTYKADVALELEEPQWAVNLCNQALASDPDNGHAFYQLACAYTALNQFDEAVRYLTEALARAETYRDDLLSDAALVPLKSYEPFNQLLGRVRED